MVIYLYWAVKKGNPLWYEELVLESEKRVDMKEFKKLMKEKGYHHVRESIFKPGEKPDFKAVKL